MEVCLFKPKDTPKKDKTRKPLSNMFDCLNVYTPSETFLNAPDITPEPSVQYAIEQEPTLEDATFELLTLLGDLENIKDEISELWKKYAAGKIDLAAAVVATNTAFELAQSLENEVKGLLDKFDGSFLLMNSLFQSACEIMGIDWAQKARNEAFNIRGYSLAKDMHINTMSLLNSYVDQSREVCIINIYNGTLGRYDEELGAKGKTNSEKWAQDRGAMMALLPDLQFLGSRGGRGNVEDKLVRATGELFANPTKKVGFWFAWALNVWLDILQDFGSNCVQAYEELKQESLKIQKALLSLPDTPQRTHVLETVTRWNRDPTHIARTDLIETGTVSSDGLPPEFTFLRRHPIFCGLLLHYRCQLHEKGVELAAPSGGLMCTTQLYQALRNENRLPDKKWDDLETFWEYQGDPCFFVGEPPKDREGYYKNFTLSKGVSVSNWAPNRRSGKPAMQKNNMRNMKFDGWVSLKVDRRLHIADKREPWTEAYVTELLTDGRTKEMQDGKGKTYANVKGKEKEHEPLPSTPEEIIRHLAQVIDKQVPRIAFNYFNMHYISWDFLASLKDAFTKAIGPEFLNAVPDEDRLPLVVGYVFSTAAGHSSEDVRIRGAGNDSLINIATEIVNDFLDSGMGSWITKVSQQDVNPEEVEGLDIDGSKNWTGNAIGNVMRAGPGAFEGRDKPTARDLEKLMGMLGLNRAEMNDVVQRAGY